MSTRQAIKKEKGFTLIELLVVISIIALLVSILLPALKQAREQARSVVCKANLSQWGLTMSIYLDDYNDSFWGGWNSGNQDGCWMVATQDYWEAPSERFECPSTKSTNANASLAPADSRTFVPWTGDAALFPSPPVPNKFSAIANKLKGSYGVNWWVSNPVNLIFGVPTGMPPGTSVDDFWRRRVDVDKASDVPLLIDSQFWIVRPHHDDVPPVFDGEWFLSGTGDQMKRVSINRHSGSVNSLFVDGSARGVQLKELWQLKWHRSFDTTVQPIWPSWMP